MSLLPPGEVRFRGESLVLRLPRPRRSGDRVLKRLAAVVGGLVTLTVSTVALHGPHVAAVTAAVGDAARGAKLFATLPCVSCHDIAGRWPGGEICPNLGNIATEAARIIRSRDYRGKARDAAGYIRESITEPNAYIVPGVNYRTPDGQSVMPKNFGETLTASQLDDLVAFLLTKR